MKNKLKYIKTFEFFGRMLPSFNTNEKMMPLFLEIKEYFKNKYSSIFIEHDENGRFGEEGFQNMNLSIQAIKNGELVIILSYDDFDVNSGDNFYIRTDIDEIGNKFNFSTSSKKKNFKYVKHFKFRANDKHFNNQLKHEIYKLVEDILDPNSKEYKKSNLPKNNSNGKSIFKKWLD